MMTRHEKLKLLRERNPFASSSAGDPWAGNHPNAESVNRNAFEGLCRLIRQKAMTPGQIFAGLVLGEIGSGKTHLVGRICEQGRQSEVSFPFAYIQPIEDPTGTYGYLLRELVINLCRSMNPCSHISCLDRILAQIFTEELEKIFRTSRVEKHVTFLSRLRQDPTNIFRSRMMSPAALEHVEKRCFRRMLTDYPELPYNFLKVLFQYRVPEKRLAALNWLKGTLMGDNDLALLDVPSRRHKSEAFLEQEARDMLNALGSLFTQYHHPMVICFDRLENLETDGQIQALGKMLRFIMDTVKSMLPLVCVRTLQWHDAFKSRLDQHITTRLENNTFELDGCPLEPSLDIIRQRLASVLEEDQENGFFPFDRDELVQIYEDGLKSPREVITQANHILRDLLDRKQWESPDVMEQLQDEFDIRHQKTLSNPDSQPDRGLLRDALELFLACIPSENNFQIESLLRPTGENHIDFTCTVTSVDAEPVHAVFMIDVDQTAASVEDCLRRGLDFLIESPSGKLFYIRDNRDPFPKSPRWRASNDMLKSIRERGGHVILLDDKHAARWYALALLNHAVKEGDVTVSDPDNQMKFVSSEEFTSFVREKIHPVFQNLNDALKSFPKKSVGKQEAE